MATAFVNLMKYLVVWIKMQQTTVQMQQSKIIMSGVLRFVHMRAVKIFQQIWVAYGQMELLLNGGKDGGTVQLMMDKFVVCMK